MNIWVVSGCWDYEGCDVAKAFDSLKKAKAFKKRCELHDERKPQVPEIEDDDSLWDKYEKQEKKWRNSHPARPGGYDGYSIDKLKLDTDKLQLSTP